MPYNSEMEDATTFFRMHLSVADLENLARQDRFTPVSGDALAVYREYDLT